MQEEQGKGKSKKVFKFMPLSLHLETLGGIATPIVLRGTKLPVARTNTFTTAEDNQRAIETHVLVGESPIANRNQSIGKYRLENIAEAKRGVPQIRLNIEVNQDCCINIEMMELGSKNAIRQKVTIPEYLLDNNQIENILKEADVRKSEDENTVKLIEARNSAENTIAKAELLVANTHNSEIEKGIAELGLALESNNVGLIVTRDLTLKNMVKKADPFGNMFADEDIFSTIFGNFTMQPRTTKQPSIVKKYGNIPKEAGKKESIKDEASKQQIGRIFGGGRYTQESNLCFVLMPFSGDMNEVYEDHIKTIVEDEGFSCIRADEIVGTNAIIKDIWERINRARFLIADLTAKNPNVFYEAGLAHAIGKEVILLTQYIDDVPFDLRQLRCIVYSWNPRGAKELEKKLLSTIKEIMRAG